MVPVPSATHVITEELFMIRERPYANFSSPFLSACTLNFNDQLNYRISITSEIPSYHACK